MSKKSIGDKNISRYVIFWNTRRLKELSMLEISKLWLPKEQKQAKTETLRKNLSEKSVEGIKE